LVLEAPIVTVKSLNNTPGHVSESFTIDANNLELLGESQASLEFFDFCDTHLAFSADQTEVTGSMVSSGGDQTYSGAVTFGNENSDNPDGGFLDFRSEDGNITFNGSLTPSATVETLNIIAQDPGKGAFFHGPVGDLNLINHVNIDAGNIFLSGECVRSRIGQVYGGIVSIASDVHLQTSEENSLISLVDGARHHSTEPPLGSLTINGKVISLPTNPLILMSRPRLSGTNERDQIQSLAYDEFPFLQNHLELLRYLDALGFEITPYYVDFVAEPHDYLVGRYETAGAPGASLEELERCTNALLYDKQISAMGSDSMSIHERWAAVKEKVRADSGNLANSMWIRKLGCLSRAMNGVF
jgi:hypothetical protein